MAAPAIQQQQQQQQLPDTTSIPGYIILPDPDENAPQAAAPPRTAVHPLDQLSAVEITTTARLIREHASPQQVKFNCITLREPKKNEYAAFRSRVGPRPERRAFAIVLEQGATSSSSVAEVIVNLTHGRVEDWRAVRNVAPTLTLEDLDVMERIARTDARVVEACAEIGITDMSTVFFDAWAIGVDARWGFERRLQQGLPYWRASPSDNQYAHPLDFTVVADTETEEVLAVDVRRVHGERTAVPPTSHNYLPEFIGEAMYQPRRLKPIDITQPEGVSFEMRGNEIHWAGYKMHIGFNYREGIVLSDVRFADPWQGHRERTLFNRVSVVEMVVPYGHPAPPHHRKHAFDVGEYGSGFMTNSLKLGCDCKGAIHYLDAVLSTNKGQAAVIKNAVCIHEEDNGLLYKHTDFRDASVVSARDRKLVISQIITAANYEYGFYHTFTLDGTYKLEMKLTGMLNTYCLHPSETAAPFGTEVAPGITAHNHQHIFSLRVDPEVDGPNNTVVQSDAVPYEADVGSPENPFGNGFYCRKTPLRTATQGAADYCHETSRAWDIVNPSRLNPSARRPVAYKILNNNCPAALAKPGSTVWRRAAFARKALWVVPYRDYELFPAGDYVCQSTGDEGHEGNLTVLDWSNRDESIEDTDIVCYIQFGLTHFPRTEDFPIMPAEPVSVTLRASNFFEKNPALWVPPSQIKGDDGSSRNAFSETGGSCCGGGSGKKLPSHL
ncbi:Primary-amine oxidase [Purpureocillium takamizusanense]|uniref:Amine oxidase n=1 Tax=Purpureocillium takamizusanense TaxID=2060973 RepID=A0A9Q8QUA6_9HYPO|nr:Primary-amine oxidase [Purpureocillium takamizusanense]UNI24869.1 Primary-amine oxidase [Purpureocillium takamizusanense]